MIARPQESYAMAFIGDLHQKSRTLLESACDRVVTTGNPSLARELQHMLDAAHRRLVALLAEHRLATQESRRAVTVAVVAQAAQVNVGAGR